MTQDWYNDDPWSAFDPEVAAALKSVFDQEFQTSAQPYLDQLTREAEDRAFAADEQRMRAIYPDYEKQRAAVLNFAVDNNIADLDLAYRAFRGSQDPSDQPRAARAREESVDQRWQERDARIEQLRHQDDHASRRELANLEHERDEDRDARARKMFQDANGADGFRQQTIGEINRARDLRTTERTMRALLGH